MRLHGKTAIVTGAGSGFGAGIAEKFAAEGATVMVADINLNAAQTIAEPIGAVAQHVDVSRDSSVAEMIGAAQALSGRIDILVNNAGVTHLPQAMDHVSEEEFDQVFAVNAKSVFLTARHLVPLLKRQRSGAILNIASTAGVSPRPNLNWYNASKGWMITATKAMAVELAPFNIRVNALNTWPVKHHCSPVSWEKTRQKCGQNFSRLFHLGVFQHRRIWDMPLAFCAPMKPV